MPNKYAGCSSAKELLSALYRENYRKLLLAAAEHKEYHLLAEEIVQSVFRDALRNYELLAVHEDPDSWLTQALQSRIRVMDRKIKQRNPQELTEWRQNLNRLYEKFGRIDLSILQNTLFNSREKLLFDMYFLEGCSLRELSALSGLPESRLQMILTAILEKLLT